jgi:hypothetical protein
MSPLGSLSGSRSRTIRETKNEDTYNNTSSSALRARARARVAGYIGENDYCTKGFPNLSENGYDYFN